MVRAQDPRDVQVRFNTHWAAKLEKVSATTFSSVSFSSNSLLDDRVPAQTPYLPTGAIHRGQQVTLMQNVVAALIYPFREQVDGLRRTRRW